MADDDPTTSPMLAAIDARLDALEQGGGGIQTFEFGFDTPGIAAGVDTGMSILAGTWLPYGFDWFQYIEEMTADRAGNFTFAIGRGPDIGTPAAHGPDYIAGSGSAFPHPVDPAMDEAGLIIVPGATAAISQGALVTTETELWIKYVPVDTGAGFPVWTGGRLIFGLKT